MWTKIDDQFFLSVKNSRMDRDEQDVYLAGLVWCNGQLTDGFIPEGKLPMLALWAKLNGTMDIEAIASRLVAHGFWEAAQGGYQVHDFLDWNPSRAEVLAVREARAEAGRRGGLQSGVSRRPSEANAQAKPKQNRSKTEPRTRTRTSPDIPSSSDEDDGDLPKAVAVYLRNGGRFPTGTLADGTPKRVRAMQYIEEHVASDAASLGLWARVVAAYCVQWSDKSYTIMVTDYYLRGRIPGEARPVAVVKSKTSADSLRDGYRVPPGYEGLVKS